MSGFQLKIIAVITMLIDHIGAFLLPQYAVLRYVGRLSFPIYCFLISEGARHTRNIYKYLLRLTVFAFISEIPFNLIHGAGLIEFGSTNVFFTLAIGTAAIICIQKVKNKALTVLLILALSAGAYLINCDYDWYGVLMIVGFYLAKNREAGVSAVQAGAAQLYCIEKMIQYKVSMLRISQQWSMLSIPFLLMYNGKKGYSGKAVQILFYVFYPVHLLVLWAVSLAI